jgi:hypothetical protein
MVKGGHELAAAAARPAATSAEAYERFVAQAEAVVAAAARAAADEQGRAPAVAASGPDLAARAVEAAAGSAVVQSRTLPRSRLRPVPRLHRAWERS